MIAAAALTVVGSEMISADGWTTVLVADPSVKPGADPVTRDVPVVPSTPWM